ncbi:MAG: type VI secretion system contractile sheath large subunit [Isosphaeraceae bacterium]|nr:type VI secretion system contractile sheath large subunit [Isosphaeraceae bacterium]
MGITSESVRFVVDPEAGEAGGRLGEPPPFRILILGDFSGKGDSGTAESIGAPMAVDRDVIDRVLASVGPKLELPSAGDAAPIEISFREIDDFTPDRIFARVSRFEELGDALRRLERGGGSEGAAPGGSGNLLDMILGASVAKPAAPAPVPASPIEAFFREVGETHAVSADRAVDPGLRGGLASALGRLMSSILHHPRFQALEASWRSLDRLTRKLDTDRTLGIAILDVSKSALAADFSSAGRLEKSKIHERVVAPAIGDAKAPKWSVIVADYEFGPTQEDVVLLGYLGMLAKAAGAPVLAGASPKLLGSPAIHESPEPRSWDRDANDDGQAAFDALRTLPVAPWIGLALPRLLARLPYSVSDRPIEAFAYDEFPVDSPPAHEHFVWANPSYALAELLGRSFREDEWEMKPGTQTELLDLPVFVDRSTADHEILPCAEVIFTQASVEEILDHGLMPMLSYRNRDAVRVGRFQSIANPPGPLSGPWRI